MEMCIFFIVAMVSQEHTYVKIQQSTNFKYMHFILCQLGLHEVLKNKQTQQHQRCYLFRSTNTNDKITK